MVYFNITDYLLQNKKSTVGINTSQLNDRHVHLYLRQVELNPNSPSRIHTKYNCQITAIKVDSIDEEMIGKQEVVRI